MSADTIWLGRGRNFQALVRAEWEHHLAAAPQEHRTRLGFMTPAHHQVRYFVVRELPRTGQPIPPELIAERLRLPLSQVTAILTDLERHLFFLVRNAAGAVSWAFPLTVERTPHGIVLNTGESFYGA